MTLRAELPVYSPLSLGALAAGVAGMFAADHRAGLERALADEYGSAAVLLTDSGTSALALALRAAVRERPGAVALPAYGCYDIATAADAAEVRFALYDIEPA
ncbi:MAG TPA: hypothetical protein VFK09_01925, partial [Gemmatimonadales bacterium]|nr:hypothetical protein [Gemmatimonadales bacterium]